jgi:hypothetical protein
MYLSRPDFMILAGILSAIGGLGLYEGYEVHPIFYSQSALLFGSVGYAGYKVFFADNKEKLTTSVNSRESRSESQ